MSEKRYWFRVYDVELEERIEKYYSKNKKQFKSRNEFLKTCCDYGLTMLENSTKLNVEQYLRNKDFAINQIVNQEMLSAIFKIITAKFYDTEITKSQIYEMKGLPYKFRMMKSDIEDGGD